MILPTPVKKRSLLEIITEKKLLEQQRLESSKLASVPLPESIPTALATVLYPPINPTTPQNPSILKKLSLKEIMALRMNKSVNVAIEEKEKTDSNEQIEENLLPLPTPTEVIEIAESATDSAEDVEVYKGAFSLDIILNDKQLLAKEMTSLGKSLCLIGAAGTGKTTAQREVARSLLEAKCLSTHDFRIQGTPLRAICPSIAFVAYTRIASANLKRAVHKLPALEEALQHNITTLHNLLEYTPETYWSDDLQKECFRFTPRRTRSNPLDITHLVIEEASMVGLDLWSKLYDALRPGVQVIFIGDINQLPPVFGDSILNYALVQLPVVELTHVYRQAQDSTILKNAHNILAGKMVEEAADFKLIRCGKENHTQGKLSASLGMTFPKWAKAGEYDPVQDIILSPWNKRELGTDNMNKWIAQFLGTERGATVHQIIAGISKLYLAVGDKVLYNKRVGVITKIVPNGRYMGKAALPASINLNRFGTYTGSENDLEDLESMDYSSLNLDAMLEDDKGDATKEASHLVDIFLDDGEEEVLSAIGDYAPSVFSLAYALTVHKAQGCEWRKVYLILHRDHNISLCRELLYTAVTRAREQMIIIAKEEVIQRAIKTQRIKGNTLAEKIEYFNSGVKLNNVVHCTK